MRPVPIIRSATPSDADGIAALWLQLNQTGELVDDRYLLKHDVDTIGHHLIAEDWLAEDTTQVVVADDDGTLVAFIATRPLETSRVRLTKPGVLVTDLFVAPSHRRRGVGRQIVEAVIDREAMANRESIEVGTLAKDSRAIAFWRSLGFGDWRVTFERPVSQDAVSPTEV